MYNFLTFMLAALLAVILNYFTGGDSPYFFLGWLFATIFIWVLLSGVVAFIRIWRSAAP